MQPEQDLQNRYHLIPLKVVDGFLRRKKWKIRITEGDEVYQETSSANLDDKGFHFSVNTRFNPEPISILEIESKNTLLRSYRHFKTESGTSIEEGIAKFTTSVTSHELSSVKDGAHKFLTVIPCDISHDFVFTLERFPFKNDLGSNSLGMLFIFDQNQVTLSVLKFKNTAYVIIESYTPTSLSQFDKWVYAICLTLGYVLGKQPGGYSFTFSKKSNHKCNPHQFKYRIMYPSSKSLQIPIYGNIYGFSGNSLYAENRRNIPKLTIQQYSKLAQLILADDDIELSVLQLCEAHDLNIVLRPSVYCIILETLASRFVSKQIEPGRTTHIDKKIFKEELAYPIINLVLALDVDDSIKANLRDGIYNINQLSNKQKLAKMFKDVGVELTEEDIGILDFRNKLLHGMPSDVKKLPSDYQGDINSALWYASDKLFTLLSLYIFRLIGYQGPVLDWVVINRTEHEDRENFLRYE